MKRLILSILMLFALAGTGGGRFPADCQPQAAARIRDRAVRPRTQCTADGARQKHAVCRQHARRQGLRDSAQGRAQAGGHCRRTQSAGGRGVSRRRSVRVGGEPHPAAARHRGAPEQAAAPRGRQQRLPERHPSRLEIHRLRPRRQALCAGGCAVQHLRARSGSLRRHHRARCGERQDRGGRARGTQQRRLRLAAAKRRTVVHRQWP